MISFADNIHTYALGIEFVHIDHRALFHTPNQHGPTLVCFDPYGVPNGH